MEKAGLLSDLIPVLPISGTTLLIAIACFYAFYHFIIHPLYISPLSKVPGPKLAALSSLYLDGYYAYETGCSQVEKLHRKYGPIVRVGPSEVVINDPSHVSTVYGVRSTWPKPSSAILFQNYGHPNSFSSVTRDEHRERRRITSKVYTMNAVLNNAELISFIQQRLEKVIEIVDARSDQVLDFFSVAVFFALDNVTHMVFGRTFDSLGGHNHKAAEFIRISTAAAVPSVRSPLLVSIFNLWPLRKIRPIAMERAAMTDDSGGIDTMVQKELIDKIDIAESGKASEKSAYGYMCSQPGYGETYTAGHVASECLDHVNAGADSTGASISFYMYELARPENKHYQDRLRAEVLSLPQGHSFADICNLPFLNSCTYELLRFYSPGPGSLQQRLVPSTPRTTPISVQGKRYDLPANTMVGIQAYSLHRNQDAFGENLERFWPERWENATEAEMHAMKEAWIPFGAGARMCIGMNLAMVEVKVMIAEILRNFTVELPPDFEPDNMIPILSAVIRPKSERCDLVFRRTKAGV